MRSHGRGELLVSLCYQPQASRLTAVVLKARNIPRMDMTGLAGKHDLTFLNNESLINSNYWSRDWLIVGWC